MPASRGPRHPISARRRFCKCSHPALRKCSFDLLPSLRNVLSGSGRRRHLRRQRVLGHHRLAVRAAGRSAVWLRVLMVLMRARGVLDMRLWIGATHRCHWVEVRQFVSRGDEDLLDPG